MSNDSDSCDSLGSCTECCSEEEKPLEAGYERIRIKCGGYYDQKIATEGEIRCDRCRNPFPKDKMNVNESPKTSGNGWASLLVNVCFECLDSGRVIRCKGGCGRFLRKEKPLPMFGDLTYCNDCRPAITFTFVDGDHAVDIEVPRGKESALPTNYFYRELSRIMKVDPRNLYIKGLWPMAMVCAAEFKPKDRIFKVEIVNNSCTCGTCKKCQLFGKDLDLGTNDTKYGDWLFPGLN